MNCPCNPEKLYSHCCGIVHKDITRVQSAEQLMRSRYSAFVLADIEYLKRSHHSSTSPNKREYRDIEKWTRSVTWVRLEIIQTVLGAVTDASGTVTFKAYFYEDSNIQVLEENSRFVIENDHWVYLEASK